MRNRHGIAALLVLQLAGGFILSPQRTFFPVFAETAGLPVVLIATISSLRQVAGMLAALLGGILADRIGRKWTYFIGNAGFILGAILFVTTGGGAVAVLWISSGFLLGIRTTGGQSYLIDVSRSGSLGIMSAFFTWGTTLGGAGGSLILGLLLDRSGYVVFGFALSVLSAATLAVNGVFMPASAPKDDQSKSSPAPVGYGDIIRKRSVSVVAALRFLPTFYWGMATVLVPILIKDLGGSTIALAVYGTVSQIMASAAQLLTGRVADRKGFFEPTRIVLIVLFASILATAIWADDLTAVFIASTIAASAAWSMSSLVPVLVSHTVNPAWRAKTLGWIHLWWNVGMVVGAAVGGLLYETDHRLPFAVAAGANVLPIALLYFLRKYDTSESG